MPEEWREPRQGRDSPVDMPAAALSPRTGRYRPVMPAYFFGSVFPS